MATDTSCPIIPCPNLRTRLLSAHLSCRTQHVFCKNMVTSLDTIHVFTLVTHIRKGVLWSDAPSSPGIPRTQCSACLACTVYRPCGLGYSEKQFWRQAMHSPSPSCTSTFPPVDWAWWFILSWSWWGLTDLTYTILGFYRHLVTDSCHSRNAWVSLECACKNWIYVAAFTLLQHP